MAGRGGGGGGGLTLRPNPHGASGRGSVWLDGLKQGLAGRGAALRRGGKLPVVLGVAALLLLGGFIFSGGSSTERGGGGVQSLGYDRGPYYSPAVAGSVGTRATELVAGCGSTVITFAVVDQAQESLIRITSRSTDIAIKEAVAAGTGLRPGAFGLKDADGVVVAISAGSLEDGATYKVLKLKAAACPYDEGGRTGAVQQVARASQGNENGNQGVLESGTVLSGKPARLSRVVFTCIGTGRYRPLAITALETVRDKFGGDALVSLHLLTDNLEGVSAEYNPALITYKEWPLSGLGKFEDILATLESEIADADYFYFLDGDVRFQEDVRLADVAGDLVAVEHPMYPRNEWGWCVPGKITMCEYPYERKPQSSAYIPETYGKFKKTLRSGENIFMSNSYYLQSAFWGGKSEFILPALRELKRRVDIDVAANYFSSIIQDERYVNWYFWKQTNNSRINIRWLSPSYLYPFRSKGFGPYIINASRPIIVHGTAKAGKMLIGEHEIKVEGAGGKKGTCFDTFLGDKIGTYACHDPEYRGGTQGFVWLEENGDSGQLRTTETIKLCVDGNDQKAGDPVLMKKCIKGKGKSVEGQLWVFDKKNLRFYNKRTKLCMDAMRFDRQSYPQAAKDNRWPVTMQPCGKSARQRLEIWRVDVEENAKHANVKRAKGQY